MSTADRDRVLAAATREPEYLSRLLDQIEGQVRIAREAIADEAEGDLRRAVLFIAADAEDLETLVTSW